MFKKQSLSVSLFILISTLFTSLACSSGNSGIIIIDPESPTTSQTAFLFDVTARYEESTALVWLGAPPETTVGGALVKITLPNQSVKNLRALPDGSFLFRFPGDSDSSVIVEFTDSNGNFRTLNVPVTDPQDDLQECIAYAGLYPNRLEVHGNLAWVVNSGDDALTSYDLETLQTGPYEITVPAYSNPWDAAFINAESGIITTLFNGVYMFDAQSGITTPIDTNGFSAFASPNGCVILNDSAWVANPNPISYFPTEFGTGWVAEIALDDRPGVVGEIVTTWLNPQNVITDGKYIYVSCSGTIDFLPPDYIATALSPGGVDVIDPVEGEIVASYNLGMGGPGPMAISPDNRYLYAGSSVAGWLFRIDLYEDRVLNDADNPIVISDSYVTYIPGIEMLPNGLMAVPSFNNDWIVFVDSFTGEVNPFPFFEPLNPHQPTINPQACSERFYGFQDIKFCERNGEKGLLILSTVTSGFSWLPM